MILDSIVEELKLEKERLDRAIVALEGSASPIVDRKRPAQQRAAPKKKRRGGMTPAGRRRLSLAMKRRWAERRKKGS